MDSRGEERRRVKASDSDEADMPFKGGLRDASPHLPDDHKSEKEHSVWLYGMALALSYSATYFWRYPIFALPLDTLEQTVFTVGGKDVDLQTCYSLALTLGFGIAKMPAVSIMSSSFFYRYRQTFILCTMWISCFFMGFGTVVFYSKHVLYIQVVLLFFSFFFSSWIYGAMLSYIEGRMGTEALLATMNFCYIYAGNASRGTGQLVLNGGLSARSMPLVVALSFGLLGTVLFLYAAKIPPPSAYDVQNRTKRVAMSSEKRMIFLRENASGILCMLIPYALLSLIRSYRDFYSQQVFSATVGQEDVPSYMFFTVDIPGALIACIIQYSFHKIHKNAVAYVGMLCVMIASVGLMLLSTILFDSTGRQSAVGFIWQVLVGMGIYVAYSILGTAAWDRLFGLLRVEGTCTFIVFMGDGLGYIGTTTLLLYKTFGESSGDDDDATDEDDSENNDEYLDLFVSVVYAGSIIIILCLSFAIMYFVRKSGTISEVKRTFKCFKEHGYEHLLSEEDDAK